MEKLQILWVSKTYAVPGAVNKIHEHPYYQLFHIHSGSIRLTAGGTEYLLQAGQSLLVPSGVEHGYINDTDVTMEDYEVRFQVTQTVMDAALQKQGVTLSDDPLVGQLVEQMVEEYSDLGRGADDAAASYMMTVLNLLTKPQRYQKKQNFRFVDADSYSQLSQQIIRYLEKNYEKDITLDSLAAELDYNKSYLCVAFKKETQSTILDCLNMIRIRRAVELITYSDHSLPQIAAMCGFISGSHFTRTFSKYVGITPGQCRRIRPTNLVREPVGAPGFDDRPPQFVHDVLAQKQITPEMIRSMDQKRESAPQNVKNSKQKRS